MRSDIVNVITALTLVFIQLAICIPADLQSSDQFDEPDVAESAAISYRTLPNRSAIDDQIIEIGEKRHHSSHYCGKRLADALDILCRGRYNVPFKKSSPDRQETPYWLLSEGSNSKTKYPFRPRSLAAALIPIPRRRKEPGGVYDECCVKSCSLREMSSYCSSGR